MILRCAGLFVAAFLIRVANPAVGQTIYDPTVDRSYTFEPAATSWPAARGAALTAGGDLISIGSQRENDIANLLTPANAWIGFTDSEALGGVEFGNTSLDAPPPIGNRGRGWVWSDGSPVTFQAWGPGEPNDFNNNEDFAQIRPDGFWNDSPLAFNHPSVREFSGMRMTEFRGHFYVVLAPADWQAAQAQAAALGGLLVTINDAEENAFIASILPSGAEAWTGLNDLAVEGDFNWVSGDFLGYTNWLANEPNNAGNEDAVTISQGTGKWKDAQAGLSRAAVVEFAPVAGNFTNGSFEEPALTVQQESLSPGSTRMPGWTVAGSEAVVLGRGQDAVVDFDPIDGQQYVLFNTGARGSGGAVMQLINTVPGFSYRVGFRLGRSGAGAGVVRLSAEARSAADAVLGDKVVEVADVGWSVASSLSFVATTDTTRLIFTDASLATADVDLLMDAVTVIATEFPDAFTQAPEAVGNSSAILRGLVNSNGSAAFAHFEYGSSAAYGNATALEAIPAGSAPAQIQAPLPALAPGTTYHYRVVMTSAAGSAFGQDQQFTTLPLAPSIEQQSASLTSATTGLLNALVNAGGAETRVYFEYGATPAYGARTAELVLPAGGAAVEVARAITGLAPHATYHFRAVATSAGGTVLAPDASFTVPNSAPAAADDTAGTLGLLPIRIHVLGNDADADGDTLILTGVTQGAHGVSAIVNNTIIYTPTSTIAKVDTFTYTVSDGFGGSATAAVQVTDRGTAGVGSFLGLVEGVTPGAQDAGQARLAITKGGKFTGKLSFAGAVLTMKGAFDLFGEASGLLVDPRKRLLTWRLQLADDGASVALVIMDGVHQYESTLLRAAVAATDAGSEAGLFTFEMRPDEADLDAPAGTGFGTLQIGAKGDARFKGRLGDGTAYAAAGQLRRDGKVQLFLSLYGKGAAAGEVSGLLTFRDRAGLSDLDGEVHWRRPAQVKPGPFAAGFMTTSEWNGCRFARPAAGVPVLDFGEETGNAILEFSRGSLVAPVSATATLTSRNQLVPELRTVLPKAGLNATRGLFSGVAAFPGSTEKRRFQGAILQKQNAGRGYFVEQAGTGSVELRKK